MLSNGVDDVSVDLIGKVGRQLQLHISYNDICLKPTGHE